MPANRQYKKPTEERLTKAAVHYLERYASTEENLRRVLERKVFRVCNALDLMPEEFNTVIDAVVEKCVRNGLVDDTSFAEMKLASLRRKGQSRQKIQAQLRAKGVSAELIERVLSEDTTEEKDAALSYAKRRRFGPFGDPAKRADRRMKDLAAMCRAGFDYQTACSVIDTEDPEPEC